MSSSHFFFTCFERSTIAGTHVAIKTSSTTIFYLWFFVVTLLSTMLFSLYFYLFISLLHTLLSLILGLFSKILVIAFLKSSPLFIQIIFCCFGFSLYIPNISFSMCLILQFVIFYFSIFCVWYIFRSLYLNSFSERSGHSIF